MTTPVTKNAIVEQPNDCFAVETLKEEIETPLNVEIQSNGCENPTNKSEEILDSAIGLLSITHDKTLENFATEFMNDQKEEAENLQHIKGRFSTIMPQVTKRAISHSKPITDPKFADTLFSTTTLHDLFQPLKFDLDFLETLAKKAEQSHESLPDLSVD